MTRVHANIIYPFIEGLRNEEVVRDDTAKTLFPDIEPVGYETAVRRGLDSLESGQVETRRSDSLASTVGGVKPVELTTEQGLQIERRQQVVGAPPKDVYAV
jgi:hypothetical protein